VALPAISAFYFLLSAFPPVGFSRPFEVPHWILDVRCWLLDVEGMTSKKRGGMILTVKTKDTVLTSKGTTSIPAAIRQAAGLFPGSR
jgi:hypothetical protein